MRMHALLAAVMFASCTPLSFEFYTPEYLSGAEGTGGAGDALLCSPGAVQACYDGPAGTEGHGICKAGTQTCAADGMSWETCVGAVLPRAEDCATPEDEDCDGKAPACTGKLLWARQYGDTQVQEAADVAVDGGGNVVIVGRTFGSVSFGGNAIPPPACFVAKLDADGNHLWSKGFSGVGDCRAVALDGAGNVLITGTFYGSIDLGGGVLTGNHAGFIAKLGPNGHHVWSKSFGDEADGTSIAVDGAGVEVVSGSFSSSLDFGGAALTSTGDEDLFVAKLDPDGNHAWSKRFGGAGEQVDIHVAVDDADDVLIAGGFAGTMDFGGGPLTSAGLADMFVAKLGPDGGHVWSKRWGSTGSAIIVAVDIAVDVGGDVLLTGVLAGSVEVAGGHLESTSAADVFAAKLDTSGSYVWGKSFGALGLLGPTAHQGVAAAPHGNVLLTGHVRGVADFGGGQVTCAGGDDAFVAKLAPDGGYVWAKIFGDAQDQDGNAIAADAAGGALVVGTFAGTVNFGEGSMTSAGQRDVFVARFAP